MDFKEFVELTRPVIGGKGGVHKFVRTLFDAMLTDDDRDILEDYSNSSYKAYANGRCRITGIAKAISPNIDQVEFALFIDQFSDSAQLELCERFKTYLPGINARNVGEQLADLFAGIIREASGAKRKSPVSPEDDTEPIEAEVVDGGESSGAADENVQTDAGTQIVNNPTIVNQYGEKNIHISHVDKLEL